MKEQELLPTSPVQLNNLTDMCKEIFNANYRVGWWSQQDIDSLHRPLPDGDCIKVLKYSKAGSTLISSKLALVHSEVSEGLEGMRKGLMDEHLKTEEMFGVELADVVIRVCDIAGACGIDLGRLVAEKFAYNQERADHKPENRAKDGGKTI